MEPKKIAVWLKWVALIIVMAAYIHYYQTEGEKEVKKVSSGFLELMPEAPNDVVVPSVEMSQPAEPKGDDATTTDPDEQETQASFTLFKEKEADGFFAKKIQGLVNDFAQSEDGKRLIEALATQAAREQSKENVLVKRARREPYRAHMQDVLKGKGAKAWCDSSLKIDYKGYLHAGFEFDSTFKPEHSPLVVELGAKQLIPGLEDALIGIQQGGQRLVAIPPALGFDGKDYVNDALPENTIIYYDVTVIEHTPAKNSAEHENIELREVNAGKVNDVARCGNRITVRYQLPQAGEEGKNITQQSFVLGKDDRMDVALQRVFYGVNEGAKYHLTAPRALLEKAFGNEASLPTDTAYGELDINIISVD